MTPDCTACGLCCVAPSRQDRYANLELDDIPRLPEKYRLRVIYPTPFQQLACSLADEPMFPYPCLPTKRLDARTVCVALIGKVGESVRCDVYQDRPLVCKEAIVPGDANCLSLREKEKLR